MATAEHSSCYACSLWESCTPAGTGFMLPPKTIQTQQPFPLQSHQTCDELFLTNEKGKNRNNRVRDKQEEEKKQKPRAVCQVNKLHNHGKHFLFRPWRSEPPFCLRYDGRQCRPIVHIHLISLYWRVEQRFPKNPAGHIKMISISLFWATLFYSIYTNTRS